MILKNLKLMRY